MIQQYQQSPMLQDVVSHLTEGAKGRAIHLNDVHGSSLSLIIAALYQVHKGNHIILCRDREEAAFLMQDLQFVLPKKEIYSFPSSFKQLGQIHQSDSGNIQMRTEVITQLTSNAIQSMLIISYPDALLERVVKKSVLKETRLDVEVGETFDIDFMLELLVTYNFERVDFVYEPGQFSIRGDIIDIYSFANANPYRIEVFDNEVESIRLFDPVSQRSEKKVLRISILPNGQQNFTVEEQVPLFQAIPSNTTFWINDIAMCLETVDEGMAKAIACYEKLDFDEEGFDKEDSIRVHPQKRFEISPRIKGYFEDIQLIEWGNKIYSKAMAVFEFGIDPQPVFNRNVDLLVEDLQAKKEAGYELILATEHAKHYNRVQGILQDVEANITMHPLNLDFHGGFVDRQNKILVYTDHQIFSRYHKASIRKNRSSSRAQLMKTLKEWKPGDYVVHIDHGIGVYSGLEKLDIVGRVQESIRIVYQNNDLLYVSINALHKISKYSGKDGKKPKIHRLGSDTWAKTKTKTKKKIKQVAYDLIKLYAQRKTQKGFAFSPDTYLQHELEASFFYQDTPDQEKTTLEVKNDMESDVPMDRLLCGDVGFGKTEVAIRAAFKAVTDSKQVAILVPTTILAAQHHKTLSDRLRDFPVTIEYVNRFRSASEKKAIYEKLAQGKIDICIGTHSLVGKSVQWKDLGLLIVDEEQKFGVGVKEKLKTIKLNVDTLTLTATPIPRTLQFSLMGARDLSVIRTPPENRQPVHTEVHTFSTEVITDAIQFELYRGGQVFFVHNRVKDIEEIKQMLERMLGNVRIAVGHGQMEGQALERVMVDFVDGQYDVLLSTNIIETGLDIPNANTIIINGAHMFGLSDLHQLRGRVGRSSRKAYCYLFTPPISTLSQDARLRLKTIEEFADIGSGFNIAMRDLDIRGAGNLLGGEQSGFMNDLGFQTYHKILDETIQELKATEFVELYKAEIAQKREYVRDCQIDTDLPMHIPSDYVNSVPERLALYTSLNTLKDNQGLQGFLEDVQDRFGKVPEEVRELCNAIRLKWVGKTLALERIIAKKGKLTCYFTSNQKAMFYASDAFNKVMAHVNSNPAAMRLKQTEKHLILIVDHVSTVEDAYQKLRSMEADVYGDA